VATDTNSTQDVFQTDNPLAEIVDFGAPVSYGTLYADDGAGHVIDGSLFLGAAVDGELDGLPTAGSDGDDADAPDDEDGVSLPASFLAGDPVDLEVTASAAGLLNAWMDFDRDGEFDSGEQVFTDEALVGGASTRCSSRRPRRPSRAIPMPASGSTQAVGWARTGSPATARSRTPRSPTLVASISSPDPTRPSPGQRWSRHATP
jgi:hypothetical protein